MKIKSRVNIFKQTKKELESQGYKGRKIIVHRYKVKLLSVLCVLPYILVFALLSLYHILDTNISNNVYWFFLLAIFFYGMFIQSVNAFVLSFFCKDRFKKISVHKDDYYHDFVCLALEPLPYKAYAIGKIVPYLVFGFIPFVVSLIINNYYLNIVSIGALIYSSDNLIHIIQHYKFKDCLFVDHPIKNAFWIFEKVDNKTAT